MFVQVVKGKVKDEGAINKLMDRWEEELRPGAEGFLGSTGGVAEDGTMAVVARFESAEAARRNSERPEQDAWAKEMAEAVEGVQFVDCTEADLMMGGGSDDAGFVQLIEGTTSDKEKLRAIGSEMEPEMQKMRPDVLGGIVAWHPDGKGFTQAIYFESEAKARENEASDEGPPAEITGLMDNLSYIDLRDPRMS